MIYFYKDGFGKTRRGINISLPDKMSFFEIAIRIPFWITGSDYYKDWNTYTIRYGKHIKEIGIYLHRRKESAFPVGTKMWILGLKLSKTTAGKQKICFNGERVAFDQ